MIRDNWADDTDIPLTYIMTLSKIFVNQICNYIASNGSCDKTGESLDWEAAVNFEKLLNLWESKALSLSVAVKLYATLIYQSTLLY